MRGSHCLRTYSVTQKNVTLSSAEAELKALVRASCEGIGTAQLSQGWGLPVTIGVYVDSSAALAVTARRGSGKLRHVRIGDLWVQEAAANGDVSYRRVPGSTNPADLLTKHLLAPLRAQHVERLGLRWATGHGSGQLHVHSARICRASPSSSSRPWCPTETPGRGGVSDSEHAHSHQSC